MKRFHLHVSVEDLDESVRFYSTLFAEQPTVRQTDYAKWMLEDPRINFAISTDRQPVGVNHLGFQLDSDDELRSMHAQLEATDSLGIAQFVDFAGRYLSREQAEYCTSRKTSLRNCRYAAAFGENGF